ncbi:hypothetical protein FANTH_7283 [Fusarium anthophilum]|uniref:Alcohol acetyltransferase n=1 Tax=Fusarium anthophilum TaxID=48485 RepID=A0A8H4ZEY9_9HYPO|nr:hypothetical protein FANTH_7283 [Fusarium anthophilum]
MTNNLETRTARRLGILETGSAAYHLFGLYRCVIISARYDIPLNTSPNEAILAAIANLINENPMLRVGIQGEGEMEAYFTHVPEMKLSDFVEFRTLGPGEDHDKCLNDLHCELHDQFWQNIETRAPWRVVVGRPSGVREDNGDPLFEDISFAFHHSLMDGMGGRLFHEKLLAQLNSLPPSPLAPEVLTFPEPPVLPEPQEKVIDYTSTLSGRATLLWKRYRPWFLTPGPPKIWAGEPVDFDRHKARLATVDISPEVVSTALKETRAHGTSMTGLLHALVLASLSRRIPTAPAFISSTPISMRPYISPKADPAIKNALFGAVTGMSHEHSSSAVAALQVAKGGEINDLIWSHARKVKDELKKKTSTIPVDDDMLILATVTDWKALLRKKDGQPRPRSWEVSNVGTLQAPAEGDGKRSIHRMLFTNGVMVASDPMSVSVVSVKDGPLTMGITWNDGFVEDKIIEELQEDLATYLRRLHETGIITDES